MIKKKEGKITFSTNYINVKTTSIYHKYLLCQVGKYEAQFSRHLSHDGWVVGHKMS